MLSGLKERGIDYILVYTPITKDLYSSYRNNEYFDSLMSKFGDYYNFNKILNLKDFLHFYDSNHLNQNGVKLFNKKILNLIDEKYKFNKN